MNLHSNSLYVDQLVFVCHPLNGLPLQPSSNHPPLVPASIEHEMNIERRLLIYLVNLSRVTICGTRKSLFSFFGARRNRRRPPYTLAAFIK